MKGVAKHGSSAVGAKSVPWRSHTGIGMYCAEIPEKKQFLSITVGTCTAKPCQQKFSINRKVPILKASAVRRIGPTTLVLNAHV